MHLHAYRVAVLECVVNISESGAIEPIADAGGAEVLDVHRDAHHNRTVLTMAGPHVWDAVLAVTRTTVDRLDLSAHIGVHPRIGVVDVVPWVDLDDPWAPATALSLDARDRFAAWAEHDLGVPCHLYGPERSLPELRRALRGIAGHPTAGAIAVGARGVLVAYNLWLADGGIDVARRIASAVRRPGLRTLGLQVGGHVQVSCNLTEPSRLGPDVAYDLVASMAAVARAELVGLLPEAILSAVPTHRWDALDLGPERTIEARLRR